MSIENFPKNYEVFFPGGSATKRKDGKRDDLDTDRELLQLVAYLRSKRDYTLGDPGGRPSDFFHAICEQFEAEYAELNDKKFSPLETIISTVSDVEYKCTKKCRNGRNICARKRKIFHAIYAYQDEPITLQYAFDNYIKYFIANERCSCSIEVSSQPGEL